MSGATTVGRPWAEGLANGALALRPESDRPDAAEAGYRNERPAVVAAQNQETLAYARAKQA